MVSSLTRAAANGVDVVNNSYSGPYLTYADSLATIVDQAVRGDYGRYPQMVVSAGNSTSSIRSPGIAKNAITIGAVKDGNSPNVPINFGVCQDTNWPPGERVCFSAYGPVNLDGDAYSRVKPDLVAPGVNVMSTLPGYTYGITNGTSMAVPAVSGAVALLVEHYPELTNWPEITKAILMATAVDIGGDPRYYGRGISDVYHALQAQPGVAGPVSFWGGQVITDGNTFTRTFTVPNAYAYVRVVLTWADPMILSNGDAVNDLDLYLYPNATCTDPAIAMSLLHDDTVEYIHEPAGAAGGTWCVKVLAHQLIEPPQYFGLAVYPVMAEPNLRVYADPALVQARRNVAFQFETELTNLGNTAGGTFVAVEPPAGFNFLYATLYAQGAPQATYYPTDLYAANGQWHIATGEVVKDFPRKIIWHFSSTSDHMLGAFEFKLRAYHRAAGTTLLADMNTVWVNFSEAVQTHLPIVMQPSLAADGH